MDPILMIVGALAAGAAIGVKDTAASAVKDAYLFERVSAATVRC